ncbi:hypothetical protein SAMN05444166_6188 [Singulisphaera sp. GP187]|uniref:hypothetical protein n=1 Tax=Singulisphaera sp. GP187 TaxID=1882752 RepID=UPI00092C8E47|nr:hypothetical protein [Singulisphaera sp. GP187]SIO59853.1 hypothetical protein SAMN05444166_6188 [Singulisphaera sp. GP187]
MQGHKTSYNNHLTQSTILATWMRSRFLTVVLGTACAVATFWIAPVSRAQSPFSQPPSRSGTFTLPVPAPLPRRDGMPARPSQSPSLPAPSLTPLRQIQGEVTPPRPDELSPIQEPPSPPPMLAPRAGAPPRTGALPEKPAVLPPLMGTPTEPIPRGEPILLKSGLAVTLRICQLLPTDGFSPGERLLNGRPPIQPGDCFLAELIEPCPPYPILVGGTVTKITSPGRFGRAGFVSLQMTQLVQTVEGQSGWVPWRMDLADRRFATRMRRVLLTTLLGLEGAGTGASVGAQFSGGNMAFIGGGMGVGAIVGLGYASFQRGTEANLEPGDTFEIVVGSTDYRPVSREWQTILYPAAEPSNGKVKKQ